MRVYVSSTMRDLRPFRAAVISTIRKLSYEVVAMEDYEASGSPPLEVVLRDVASCSLYVGIFAWRYGFIPEHSDRSITESEYREAVELGIPTLIFLLDEDTAWPPKHVDQDYVDQGGKRRRRIDILREELALRHTVASFTDSSDLCLKVSQALANARPNESEQSQSEVARSGGRKPKDQKRKVSLLRLPVTGKAQFGRDREIGLLDEAWARQSTNIVTLMAWGGAGKSALINTWLARLAGEGFRGAQNVFGWSFYGQESENQEVPVDVFAEEALTWFGDSNPSLGSPWEKGQRLASLVRKQRTLLILDGLEVFQHPLPPEEGKIKDQFMKALLLDLAWENQGLCLISTRLRVTDLDPFTNNTVQALPLDALTPNAGADLLASMGVNGTRAELIEAANAFGGHALALTLLGSYLTELRDGDVQWWREIPEETDQWRRVMATYEKWLGRGAESDLLCLLGLFNGPAHVDAFTSLCEPPIIAGLTDNLTGLFDNDRTRAVNKLRRLKLVAEKNIERPQLIDTHPLVRHHFAQRLQETNPGAWVEGNDRLFEYYRGLPKELPDTLNEMVNLFQAVTHGCRANRHQEAWDDVYWKRIRRGQDGYSVLTLNAYSADLAALTSFFELCWDRPARQMDDLARARLFVEVGFDLRGLGRPEQAVSLQRRGLDRHVVMENWWSAADAAGNLSETLIVLGKLKQASAEAQRSVEYAGKTDDRELVVVNRATLADVLHQMGDSVAAERHFSEAEALYREIDSSVVYLHGLRGYSFCDLLLANGDYEAATDRGKAALTVDKRPYALALARLTLARADMLKVKARGGDDFSEIRNRMQRVVADLRLAAHQELVVRGLLASAELGLAMSVYDEAETTLHEAHSAAVRDQMRLLQTDACLQYAQLYIATNRIDLARTNIQNARSKIQSMGYHRRDKELEALEAGMS